MKRFVEGEDRRQGALLPHCLDDYVTENNPVRVIEAFIDELDLATLVFDGVVPETTGRPAYHPATLLKIYLYRYLNRVQSSRRLEQEAQRNIELMWLTGRLADRRIPQGNGAAIRAVCAQFVVLCRELGLFAANSSSFIRSAGSTSALPSSSPPISRGEWPSGFGDAKMTTALLDRSRTAGAAEAPTHPRYCEHRVSLPRR